MADGVDVPVDILELDLLFFGIEQTAIHAWIDANLADVYHAADTGLEQGLHRALEDEVSACPAVRNLLCIAQGDRNDPAVGEASPQNVHACIFFKLVKTLAPVFAGASDVLEFLIVSLPGNQLPVFPVVFKLSSFITFCGFIPDGTTQHLKTDIVALDEE